MKQAQMDVILLEGSDVIATSSECAAAASHLTHLSNVTFTPYGSQYSLPSAPGHLEPGGPLEPPSEGYSFTMWEYNGSEWVSRNAGAAPELTCLYDDSGSIFDNSLLAANNDYWFYFSRTEDGGHGTIYCYTLCTGDHSSFN